MIWFLLVACTSAPTLSETRAPTPVTVDPVLGALRARPLDYTRHARCRMDCRHVSQAEVEEILRVGEVDRKRTRLDGECPSYAVEGTTSDNQRVRIVYAGCASETRVVTAIDLDTDWPCDCS